MVEQKTIDVEPKHLKLVKSVFARHLPFKEVWAFGSRVKWTANKTSDLDCVVFGATDKEIYQAQEAFNESDVPFEVQLLNWETIPDDFKDNIKKEYFLLRKESDWGERKIGDFAQVTSSKRIFLSDYVESGIPFWRSKEVIEQFKGKDISTELFISQSRYQEIKNKFGVPKEGDILLTSVGTIGVPYLVKSDDLFYFKDGNLTWIKDISNTIDSKFVFLWLSSPIGQKIIDGYLIGSSQKALTIDSLKKISLPIPPLPIQRKIAGILSAYDDLIENNNKRIKILEEIAQKLYKEWFVDFKFPNHENSKFIDSELGKIPDGWNVDTLKNVANLVMGQSPESQFYNEIGDGLPFHQGVTNFGDRFPTDKTYCTKETRIANDGDILFSVRAPVGRMNLCNKKIIIGRGVSAIRSKTNNQTFLFYQLKNQFIKEDSMGSGAIFNAVTKTDMENIKLLKPNNKVVVDYETIVVPISKEIENLTYRIENLRKTRDLLLHRLISGELAVEDLEVKI